jgi:hypothetical protein
MSHLEPDIGMSGFFAPESHRCAFLCRTIDGCLPFLVRHEDPVIDFLLRATAAFTDRIEQRGANPDASGGDVFHGYHPR